jgi:hypothetical protein
MMRRLIALLLIALPSLADTQAIARGYPSLSRRPVESRDRDAEIAAKAAAQQTQAARTATEDPALTAEVATLGQRASAASNAFDARLDAAQRAVAAGQGASIGSEAWVVAQQAISQLDSERYDSVAALASLDTLYAERSNASDPGRALADSTLIDGERRRVLAMVDGQNDRLDRLKAGLAQP